MDEASPRKSMAPSQKPFDAVKDNPTMAAIQEAVAGIRFGVVQIIIQDGRVVQIDKTEKIRLV